MMNHAFPEKVRVDGACGKNRRFTRACFAVIGCLLWLLAAGLALETSAVVRLWWIETHNPFILAVKRNASPRDSKPLPLRNGENFRRDCVDPPGWNSLVPAPALPEWAEPRQQESKEEAERRRAFFGGLNEADKNLFALLNDEWVAVIDMSGKVRHVYGNWLCRAAVEAGALPPMLLALERRLAEPGAPKPKRPGSYVNLKLDAIPDIRDDKEILLLESGDPGLFHAFIPSDFKTLRFGNLPPDTPWDGIPFFRYKKNLRNARSGLGIRFDTNNHGFRDRDIGVPKPLGVTRLLCIGGSTTEEGATNETTYPKRLEKMLQAHFGGNQSVEVFNCGISGLTTSGHLARLADYLAIEPDLLVFYEGVNDIHRDLVEYWRTVGAAPWQKLLSRSAFAAWKLNALLYPNETSIQKDIQSLVIENLHAIGRVARSRGIRMVLCSVACPDPRTVTDDERRFYDYHARTAGLDPCLNLERYAHMVHLLNEELRLFCRREGFLYVPVAERITGGYETFSDMYHMTESGIGRKAEAIFDCLKDYLPLRP
ncbi:MAG TPA: SGNH/GDSL hydrolase family protein [Candidatus Hydrogenedentes bacterium]|nr:SGNH/GDSL hydrolase family protein [Candidatus Hydrogenedentota bacterium]